jgi:ABC-2 type transport system ATP-binding protein
MIVQSHDVWKTFGRFGALQGLSLRIPEHSHFALLGANGAGKTTTIKTLMNIIKPTRGSATVLGVDSRRLSPREFERIGYVSENQDMPGRMSVGAYMSYLRPFYPEWDTTLECEILHRLRLPPERRIKDLSHGMRLKMALACALPYRPALLVMDEPLSGLDPLMRDEVVQSLVDWAGDATVLMSSHELVEVEALATDVAFLDGGKLLFQEAKSGLVSRFRDVRLTLSRDAILPPAMPREWIDVRAEGSCLSFVDTRFSGERDLAERVAAVVAEVSHLEARPMPLRSIFTALARAMREEGA